MEFRFKQFGLNHSFTTLKVGTDAVLLSALAPQIEAKNVLDIGTGCGVLALAMAQIHSEAKVTAIDIDKASIAQAADNFSLSPFADRLQAFEISLQDFANQSDNQAKYDFIISNPPFFVNSLNAPKHQRNLARHTNSLPFSALAEAVAKLLTLSGQITLILPQEQMQQLAKEFSLYHLHLLQQINIYSKPNKPIERVVSTFAFSNPTPNLSTLTLRNPDNTYTQVYKDLVSHLLL